MSFHHGRSAGPHLLGWVVLLIGFVSLTLSSGQAHASAGWGFHFRQGVVHLESEEQDVRSLDREKAWHWTSLGARAHLSLLPGLRLGAEFSSGADRSGGLTYGGATAELALRLRTVDVYLGTGLGAAYGVNRATLHLDGPDSSLPRSLFPYVEPGIGFRINLDGGNSPDAAFGFRLSYWQPLQSLKGSPELWDVLPAGNLGLTFELLTGNFF